MKPVTQHFYLLNISIALIFARYHTCINDDSNENLSDACIATCLVKFHANDPKTILMRSTYGIAPQSSNYCSSKSFCFTTCLRWASRYCLTPTSSETKLPIAADRFAFLSARLAVTVLARISVCFSFDLMFSIVASTDRSPMLLTPFA